MGGAARVWVVGDLHGCANELDVLLDALHLSGRDTIVFLGDYVDRGPDTRGVVARLIRLRDEGPRTVFLRGNHEDMFLDFIGLDGRYGEAFLRNGGWATLQSYGLGHHLSGASVLPRLPESHVDFLTTLELSFAVAPFLCVHAGVRPTRSLDDQDDEDLLWIRHDFVSAPHDFAATIVFGHTPSHEVRLDLPFKIGLDTGVVYGNKLSCLDLASGELIQVRAGERAVRRNRIELPAGITPMRSRR